ncbi:MAG: nucleotidyl transferase AbiEii/AbiGii toxin family protein [Bacteroidetes bacterium]|nr:nucleotidyl transferase AbiEii/AbiGii toxin family protein [Bacteroidota bacterium]
MDRNNPYFRQVELLVRVLPAVSESACFALKGGTAINLFYRDIPRLSVDIDLVYIPVKDRETSLVEISGEFRKIAEKIKILIPNVKIQYSMLNKTEYVTRLLITSERSMVKIEISPVLRGTVYQPGLRRMRESAEDNFGFVEISVVSFEDLYAGKIMAALDRQHPRDLFDVKYLLENEGFSLALKEAFIVYLISHNRRFLEILAPSFLDINQLFETNFKGMTTTNIGILDLVQIRGRLVKGINAILDEEDKRFLVGFKEGTPDWTYFSVSHVKNLPAVKWKMHNLNQIPSIERKKMVGELRNYFEM